MFKFVILVLGMAAQFGVAEEIPNNTMPEHIARRFNEYLMTIPSNDPVENANAVNKELKKWGYPEIDTSSPNFKFELAQMIGFAGSQVVGAAFYDGKNRYCLPCTEGRNSFSWGVAPHKMTNPKADGLYFKHLNCLAEIPGSSIEVSSQMRAPTRFASIPGTSEGRKGFYAYTDDKVFFYETELPSYGEDSSLFQDYALQLPDGTQAAIQIRLPYDPDKQRGSSDITEYRTFEINRSNLHRGEYIDLGIGRGHKMTPEANAALIQAIESQFTNLIKSAKENKWLLEGEDTCKALDKCEATGDLHGTSANLALFRRKLNCNSQRVDTSIGETKGGVGQAN